MKSTAAMAVYRAVYNGLMYAGCTMDKSYVWGKKALLRYGRNEFETPQLLIEQMIEEGSNAS